VATAYNLFSLRCLSVIRNCVQIRTLCTRQQFLYHLSLLSVFKVRVIARDSQAGMSNLILHEVAGHHTRWKRNLSRSAPVRLRTAFAREIVLLAPWTIFTLATLAP